MSIVQLSRFFVCVVLFKRQLLYFIKSFCLCQELFYFSLSLFSSFPLPSHATAYLGYHFQNSLSTTFLIYFSIISLIFKSSSFLPIKNVPPPRLLLSSVTLLFFLLFLSDECYLITAVFNCQCFLYISCNSDYSDNFFRRSSYDYSVVFNLFYMMIMLGSKLKFYYSFDPNIII